jgi:hypothetical protein
VIQIASRYGPPNQGSNILEYSPCRDWGGLDLSVDHSGYVSAMKLIERDMTNDGENVSAQIAALSQGGYAIR